MANATSIFLQSANASNTAAESSTASDIDEGAVLAAINRPDVVDLPSLAVRLDTGPTKLQPTLERLSQQGFVDVDGNNLKLSEAGERALRYMTLTNI